MEKHGARKPETRKTRNRWCWLIVQQSRRAKSDYVEGFSFIFGVTFFVGRLLCDFVLQAGNVMLSQIIHIKLHDTKPLKSNQNF